MPHGAGHVGGHHGGGHHGGGGFHHHHHHHHGGYGYAYGGPYYRYGYRRRSLGWGFFWLIIFAVAISLAVIFSVRYAVPDDNSSSEDFAPNETRTFSYSYSFCESMTAHADVASGFDGGTGSFYILSHAPALGDHDSFTFSKQPSFFIEDYHNWNFYLYPGSTLNVSVCKQKSLSDFRYYLIKGKDSFNSWAGNPRSSIAKQYFVISTVCSSGMKQQIPIYNVEKEGEYYMVFYAYNTDSDSLDIDFGVSRTKYAVDPGAVLSNCSLSSIDQDCTLDVPLSYSIGLVALHATDSTDWSSGISVTADCNARVWVYVLISLGCVITVTVLVAGIISCCCIWVRRKKKNYSALNEENQPPPVVEQAPATTTTTYVTGNQAPPPYNPSYGSTSQPPPKYF